MSVDFWKSLYGKKIRTVERNYDAFFVGEDETEKSALFSFQSKNCDCHDGVLKRGVGVKQCFVGDKALEIENGASVQLFLATEEVDGERIERFGYITKNGLAYLFNEQTGTFGNIGVLKNGAGVGAFDKDGVHVPIFVCDYGIYRLSEGKLVYVDDTSCQAVACFCAGRVFAVYEDYALRYSAPYEPKNFSDSVEGGGKLFVRDDCGKIVGLLPLKNKLCVLFEYGISVIDVAGGARSFVRKDVVYGGDKILLGTACVGNANGENVFFLSQSGIRRFDGVKVEKTAENLAVKTAENAVCYGAFSLGRYFVTYTDGENNTRTLVVDAKSGKGYEQTTMHGLFGNNVTAIGVCDDAVYRIACEGDLPSGQEAVFSTRTDFAIRGVKTLRKLRFTGEGSFFISVSNGRKRWGTEVELENGSAEVRVNMRGDTFVLSMKPNAECKINGLRAVLQTLAEV